MPDVAYSVSKGLRVFQDCAAVHDDVERCYSDVEYAYSDACVWVDGPRKLFAQNIRRACETRTLSLDLRARVSLI